MNIIDKMINHNRGKTNTYTEIEVDKNRFRFFRYQKSMKQCLKHKCCRLCDQCDAFWEKMQMNKIRPKVK